MSEWETRIKFIYKDYDSIMQVARDISNRDPTFRWRIRLIDRFWRYLIVISNSEKQAHARGAWFKNKVNSKLCWRVKEVAIKTV